MSTALPVYLAMTGWEFQSCQKKPQHTAWMACHFSPYAQGLSNIPETLPENALLMVNDRVPPHCHDPVLIARQLTDAVKQLQPRGVVLDFQRPFCDETSRIAAETGRSLPCPVAVTPSYAKTHPGAVFVPPIPPNQDISDYLKPWEGREIWLETEMSGISLTVTETGCVTEQLSEFPKEPVFANTDLCCHYGIRVLDDRAIFSLYRTEEDQNALLDKAEKLGVTLAVGLYQEFYLSTAHHTVG